MSEVGRIVATLMQAREMAIVSHVTPDGDCLGSMLALALALKQQGKRAISVNADPVPETLQFLPGQADIVSPDRVTRIPPLLVVVDSTDMERAGPVISTWDRQVEMIINIDHHVSNSFFGHLNMVDSSAAATAELIYALLQRMPVRITPEIATCLYTALITDTGSFQYENCTATTLRLAADLLEQGAKAQLMREYLWERKPLASLHLLSASLATLTLGCDNQIAWMKVTEAMLADSGLAPEYAESLVNYPRSIAGVEVSLLFRELPGGLVKVNLRSKKKVDVNRVAEAFDGGGHRRAAGCIIKGELNEVIAMVVAAVSKEL
ncbi:MAG: bifunctional oligoribonuclease/PAP phosphatase NrnA [Clostridia bacterium]|nr:bifunctional oligoribonuclease/PAP phosphatase NrnA [Clostridia bacterium]